MEIPYETLSVCYRRPGSIRVRIACTSAGTAIQVRSRHDQTRAARCSRYDRKCRPEHTTDAQRVCTFPDCVGVYLATAATCGWARLDSRSPLRHHGERRRNRTAESIRC